MNHRGGDAEGGDAEVEVISCRVGKTEGVEKTSVPSARFCQECKTTLKIIDLKTFLTPSKEAIGS